MDVLNIQPEGADVADTTQQIEGYDQHVEQIEEAYPEEDWRSPQEIAAEEAAQEQAQPEPEQAVQPEQPVEEAPVEEGPSPEEEAAARKAERTQHLTARQRNPETGLVDRDTILDAQNRQINTLPNGADIIEVQKLDRDWNEKEETIFELLSGTNLNNRLEAFNMIRNDPKLTDIYDANGDGELTFNDFHDTTHLNDGDGMTEEEDREATDAWIQGLQNKDLGTRARALLQQAPGMRSHAMLVNRRRKGYFDPSWQEDLKSSGSGAWFDIGADTLEAIGSVGDVWNKRDLRAWHEDSTFDDDILQHKNTQSKEFLVNNPLVTTEHSKDIYDGTYWVTTGALMYASGGIVGGLTKALPLGLAKAGAVYQGVTQGGAGFGIFKPIAAEALGQAAFRNYQDHSVGMMRREGLLTGLTDTVGGAAEVFGPQVANMMASPTFKKYDHIFTESALAYGGGKAFQFLGRHIFTKTGAVRSNLGKANRWAQKNADQFATSTKSHSTRISETLLDQQEFFKRAQTQATDLYDAGQVQLKKGSEGFRNAFSRATDSDGMLHSTYGAYKNGSQMIGQGWTQARSTMRQAINDLDEIAHSIGLRKSAQATDSLFNQVDMAKAAKAGISENKLSRWAKELVEDKDWGKQLREMNPLKPATRREASDSALRGIQEVMGRDEAALSPAEYWGKELLDTPLDAKSFDTLGDIDKWALNNIEVANGVNKSLLLALRDSAQAAGEMVGKTDLFATDGAMRRIADNLTVGLSQIKRTQHTHRLAREMMKAKGVTKMTPDMMADLLAASSKAATRIHGETQSNINTMLSMLMEQGDEELAEVLLDVFKASDDIHNWKDLDAFIHQQVVGGKFNGKVKTGDLVKGLQKMMVQSILSGPKTPLRAILGTTTNTYLNGINEAFGAILRAPFTNDIIHRKASIAKLKGLFEVIPEGYEVFQKQWNSKFAANIADIKTRYTEAGTGLDELWEAKRISVEKRGTAGEKAAFYINNITRNLTNNKLFSWAPRALAATDDTFLWISARARSKERAMREVLEEAGDDFTKITPDLLKKAEDRHMSHFLDANGNVDISDDAWLTKQFKEVTLTSELKGASAKLDSLFNEIPAIKPFYLFARTGINGLNFSYKNTPLLGALHKESIAILRHTGDDFTELAEYGIKNANDLASARSLFAGRQALGATVVTGMSGMYMAGQLTGNGPADRQLRQQWINAGWKPNHFYIGDVGFDYRTLEPYNVIFSTIADIGDNMELMGSEWAEKRLQAIAFVVGRGVTGKTYMSGLDQLMQIMQMKPGAFDKAAANILNNSIPLAGMRNEFGKWMNPHMKELNSDMWTSIRNRNQATEFLAADPLPEKSDLLNGKPINNWNIIGRSFNAVSPVQLDIRNDTPGRKLLLDSNYDLKSTTYAYGGYSFVKDAHVRAHFQNAIGTVPITVGFKKFKNVEEALNHLAGRKDIKNSMEDMKRDGSNPANWDIDPNTYPHNTLIDNVMNQARSKAWAKINDPSHPGYERVMKLKSEKDGKDSKTRDNRQEILDLSFPDKSIDQFPKN